MGTDPFNSRGFLYTPSTGFVDLGTVGGNYTSGAAINDAGQVAGTSSLPPTGPPEPDRRAFLYTPGSGMAAIGTLDGVYAIGSGINNAGQVLGTSSFGNNATKHAFVYTPGAGIMDLGTLHGGFSDASATNDRGQATGWSDGHAFLYTPGSGMLDLGTLGNTSVGYALNARGEVAGYSFLNSSATNSHAFIYSGGVMSDLNTLIDPALGITLTEATAINDSGQIVANGQRRAYLLTPIPEPGTALLVIAALCCIGVSAAGERPFFRWLWRH
jgi:probable HAF family extracellular repeat protein